MHLVSWNVNGMRSVLTKGFLPWLAKEKPDLLSLQEVRCEYEELDAATRRKLERDYDVCWFSATSKKGYAGSATLSRKGVGVMHARGLGVDEFDVEGRIVVTEHPQFTLLAGYFPNASEGLKRLAYKRAFSRAIAERVRALHAAGKRAIVVGDTNVAPEPIDLARPASNKRSPGFTDEEREDFRRYLAAGLVDVLRERNPDTPGLYSWWSARGGARARNVGWRIDQFLVSRALVPAVTAAELRTQVKGSDHCPITLDLAL